MTWRAQLSALALLALCGACSTTVSTTSGPVTDVRETRDRGNAPDPAETARRFRTRMDLATAYFSGGQMEVALEEVNRALGVDPGVAAAHNLRGLILASLGDVGKAEESFRKALQLNERDADALQNFGWFLCQQKRYPEADAQFVKAAALPQNRGVARTLLTQGVCQAFAGRLEEAERSLSRSYELDPTNPSTGVNLAEVLYRRGEYERARFYVRRVNAVPALVSAQTLWLAVRIESRLGNRSGVQELGNQLRTRFRESREALAFDKGQFDE